jgi:DNA-binding MarR family transcriptional regulator
MTATLFTSTDLDAALTRAADLGIDSFVRLRLLLALDAGPRTITWLAAHVGISSAAMTGQIDALERAGLARRTRPDLDRRSILIEISPSGLRSIAHILAR